MVLSRHRRKIGYFFLMLAIVVGLYLQYQSGQKIEKVANATHISLCAFKGDLQRRYESSLDFLKRHPEGIPGISADEIRRSLDSRRSALDSLGSLRCS